MKQPISRALRYLPSVSVLERILSMTAIRVSASRWFYVETSKVICQRLREPARIPKQELCAQTGRVSDPKPVFQLCLHHSQIQTERDRGRAHVAAGRDSCCQPAGRGRSRSSSPLRSADWKLALNTRWWLWGGENQPWSHVGGPRTRTCLGTQAHPIRRLLAGSSTE